MKKHCLDRGALAVLLDPWRWRLVDFRVGALNSPAVSRHRRWMAQHCHAHPYAEVMLALEGKTVYGVENRIYPCLPGSVFMFAPGQGHDNGYPPWTPAIRHLWVSLIEDKAMGRIVIGQSGRIRSAGNLCCLLDLHSLALRRQGRASISSPDRRQAVTALRMLAVLAEFAAALVEEDGCDSEGDQRDRFQREKIQAICRHISETGGADARLDHLAQVAGYSKFHFLRLFQRHTGQSVRAFVNQARRRKVEDLRERGAAFKEIAAELGFSCPAAFSRWYHALRQQAGEAQTMAKSTRRTRAVSRTAGGEIKICNRTDV